jgi:RNA polymerase sigma factor (TIGR02999 family)
MMVGAADMWGNAMPDGPDDITTLLAQIAEHGANVEDVQNRLAQRVYDELAGLSHRKLVRRRCSTGFTTTDLAQEAWIRVVQRQGAQFENRRHLFGAFATAIRRILCERARRKRPARVNLDPQHEPGAEPGVLDTFIKGEMSERLDEALRKFQSEHEFEYEVLKLHWFLGFTQMHIADVIGVPRSRVERALMFALADLRVRMRAGSE